MKFSELLKTLNIEKSIKKDFDVNGISSDSRTVEEGDIFIAVKGYNADGFSFIAQAVRKGAKAVIFDDSNKYEIKNAGDVITVPVGSTRKMLSTIAASVYKSSSNLNVIGVTGTSGKTTVTYLSEHILREQKFKTGVIGTVNYRYKNKIFESSNTTPGPIELCKIIYEMDKEKVDFVLLEVSSHALSQFRADGIKFKDVIFTNLSPEHLDFHHSMEDYFSAKKRLFTELNLRGYSIINIDDEWGRRLKDEAKSKVLTCGMDSSADVRAKNIFLKSDGLEFDLHIDGKKIFIKSKLIGVHNVYNILCVCAMIFAQGIDLESVKESIFSFEGVPGRLQRIFCGQPYSIYVDYAHKPQALEIVLKSLKGFIKGNIITVFGCGGNRDRTKRPLMGKIAEDLSDAVILTTDNPRDEEPSCIIAEILAGIKMKNKVFIEEDRKKAIEKALNLAKPGDCILLAGKGHENYQIVKDMKFEFNDVEVVRNLLRAEC
ncbi:MAG: UDP-N-acetylmuramoyl-L-alanyl-D-glutamate--2,6-diaminopimelate ligase [Candidatus Omnitrophota bacterium]